MKETRAGNANAITVKMLCALTVDPSPRRVPAPAGADGDDRDSGAGAKRRAEIRFCQIVPRKAALLKGKSKGCNREGGRPDKAVPKPADRRLRGMKIREGATVVGSSAP
jgi:hypothetical protein